MKIIDKVGAALPNLQVLVGDMNLHYPLWDRIGRLTPESATLLDIAGRWRLSLLMPWGEPTRKRFRERDSIIDYV